MTSGIRTVIYPVKNLAHAKALYGTLLGVAPSMDEAYYVGFRVGDQDIRTAPGTLIAHILKVHPRGDTTRPLTGVFAT